MSEPTLDRALADLGLHDSLLSPAFKEAEFVKLVLSAASVDRVQGQLAAALKIVNAELGTQVSERYDALIRNVQATQAIEGKLSRSSERIDDLTQSVHRIQSQSARPFGKLNASVTQLERMHESTRLLRQTQRALAQCKRPVSYTHLTLPTKA